MIVSPLPVQPGAGPSGPTASSDASGRFDALMAALITGGQGPSTTAPAGSLQPTVDLGAVLVAVTDGDAEDAAESGTGEQGDLASSATTETGRPPAGASPIAPALFAATAGAAATSSERVVATTTVPADSAVTLALASGTGSAGHAAGASEAPEQAVEELARPGGEGPVHRGAAPTPDGQSATWGPEAVAADHQLETTTSPAQPFAGQRHESSGVETVDRADPAAKDPRSTAPAFSTDARPSTSSLRVTDGDRPPASLAGGRGAPPTDDSPAATVRYPQAAGSSGPAEGARADASDRFAAAVTASPTDGQQRSAPTTPAAESVRAHTEPGVDTTAPTAAMQTSADLDVDEVVSNSTARGPQLDLRAGASARQRTQEPTVDLATPTPQTAAPAATGGERFVAAPITTPTRPAEGVAPAMQPAAVPQTLTRQASEMRQTGETLRRLVVRLDPPELGALTLEVQSIGDDIAVIARTDNAEATRALMRQRADMQLAIESLGMSLSDFDVQTGTRDEVPNRQRRSGARQPGAGGDEPFTQPQPTDDEGAIFL